MYERGEVLLKTLGYPENDLLMSMRRSKPAFAKAKMNLQGMPIATVLESIVYPDRQRMIGNEFKIAHLSLPGEKNSTDNFVE